MIPEIRLLAAKASKENDNLWLPLLDHLKDTAGVIGEQMAAGVCV